MKLDSSEPRRLCLPEDALLYVLLAAFLTGAIAAFGWLVGYAAIWPMTLGAIYLFSQEQNGRRESMSDAAYYTEHSLALFSCVAGTAIAFLLCTNSPSSFDFLTGRFGLARIEFPWEAALVTFFCYVASAARSEQLSLRRNQRL